MTVAIVGIGLIGGSLALVIKDRGMATRVIGVDDNASHEKKALELSLVDEVTSLQRAILEADIIVLAVPVHVVIRLLPGILDQVERQVVMDVGSTKEGILEAVKQHPRRGRFVATHPMWGTEFSGPEAAVHRLAARVPRRQPVRRALEARLVGMTGEACRVAHRIPRCGRLGPALRTSARREEQRRARAGDEQEECGDPAV